MHFKCHCNFYNMLDQSFSGSNFNLIFLKENRKGTIKEKYLNQEYFEMHEKFNIVLDEKIELKNSRDEKVLTIEELDFYANKLEEINRAKEEIRNNLFAEYSLIVNDERNAFCFDLKYDIQNKIYVTKKDGVHFFAIKQLQKNLSKTFKVVQADRNKIVKQIYNLISDGYPKIVIRTDIHKFYESIPQGNLFDKINNNTLLSPLSKKLLKRLFFEFETIKDKSIMKPNEGIPRGFGVSAYLSELFMREIDNEIRTLPDVIYYARYVDDIVIVFTPKTKSQTKDYLAQVRNIINNNGLNINDNLDGRSDKTQIINLLDFPLSKKVDLTFLGYKLLINQNHNLKIELSNEKIKKYIKRIEVAIRKYNFDSNFNERRSRKMLLDRLKFLTGNYSLNHNKKNVKAGIYYSNQMLALNKTPFNSLHTLNCRMYQQFTNICPPSKIGIDKAVLIEFLKSKFCFKEGFLNKKDNFYSFRFSSQEQRYYNRMFKKYTSKFEVIKSVWKDE